MRKLDPKKRQFDFAEELAKGEAGEEQFAEAHPYLTRKGKKECDFEHSDGSWVELKTDSRRDDETPNLFMEIYSDEARKVPGGPWQAYGKGADYFVYRFSDGVEYWYGCAGLVALLESPTLGNLQLHRVDNKRWSAVGAIVPKELLESIRVRCPWTE